MREKLRGGFGGETGLAAGKGTEADNRRTG